MKINEIFYSIQGEGASLGAPILFIRLAGCNLKCNFCDTQYHKDTNYTEITPELDELLSKHDKWCITGGEPLLQQNEIINLIEDYNPNWVEIETNGTITPFNDLLEKVNQWNISPKNPEQNGVKDIEYNFLKWLSNHEYSFTSHIIKFVYSNKEDEKFIENIIDEYYLENEHVFIMTEGATKKEQESNMQNVIDYCLKNDYNFSPRLHVLVWDSKKGV